jgi:hypothetical protein
MRTNFGNDFRAAPGMNGLGLDLTPFIDAAKAGADVYGKVQATKNAGRIAPPPAAPAPVIIQGQPASGGGSKTLSYLLIAMAAVGAGFIIYRAVGRRR